MIGTWLAAVAGLASVNCGWKDEGVRRKSGEENVRETKMVEREMVREKMVIWRGIDGRRGRGE